MEKKRTHSALVQQGRYMKINKEWIMQISGGDKGQKLGEVEENRQKGEIIEVI